MADVPGRNEFSADEEKQMRADRRSQYDQLPESTNIEDRRGHEDASEAVLQLKRRQRFTASPSASYSPDSAREARTAAAVSLRNTRAMPTAIRVGGD